ncbi:MAG TPA: hypothetical protein VK774_07155 [Solirubrobacteraceae bacterium]|nr:hypothetical protein [Solirubrobacteraceae bacterium]
MDTRTRLRTALESPFFDFAPWIVMSLFVGPQRFVLAASLATASSCAIAGANWLLGVKPKVLDDVGIAFFAALVVVGLAVDDVTRHWFERWSGDLSNVLIMLIALGSIAVRKPFTVQYAHETIAPEYWETEQFRRLNYRVTWVWVGAFAVTALAGFLGDGPLKQPDNLWTNWIVQIAVLILALRFTEWYPDRAIARELMQRGEPTEPPPTVRELVIPLAGYLIPVGILVLCVGGAPWWTGAGLIAIGAVAAHRLGIEEERVEEREEEQIERAGVA